MRINLPSTKRIIIVVMMALFFTGISYAQTYPETITASGGGTSGVNGDYYKSSEIPGSMITCTKGSIAKEGLPLSKKIILI